MKLGELRECCDVVRDGASEFVAAEPERLERRRERFEHPQRLVERRPCARDRISELAMLTGCAGGAHHVRRNAQKARTRETLVHCVNLLRILQIRHRAREVTRQCRLVDARIVTETEVFQAAEHAEEGLRDVACNDPISEL